MAFLEILEVACWLMLASIVALVFLLAARRWFRKRHLQRQDIWRGELEKEWGNWLRDARVAPLWLADAQRRFLLVEKSIAVIEREGELCAQSSLCSLLPTEAGLPCVEPGRDCAGPAFVRRRVEEWRLVDWQERAARSSKGLRRARQVIALGRLRSPRSIPFLTTLLDDKNADVRLAAVRALGLIGTAEAAGPLLGLLRRPALPVSIPSWQRALMHCCEKQPELLLAHLRTLSGLPATLLMRVVAELASPAMLLALEELAGHEQPQVRAHVARALSRLDEPDALPLLTRLSRDPVWFVRVRALRSLGALGGWNAAELLLNGLNDEAAPVRQAAGESLARMPLPLDELFARARGQLTPHAWGILLGEFGRQGLFWLLAEQLVSPAESVRQLAEQWLRAALASGARKTLLDALAHPQPAVADAVASFLGRWGDASLVEPLEALRRRAGSFPPLEERLRRLEQKLAAGVAG